MIVGGGVACIAVALEEQPVDDLDPSLEAVDPAWSGCEVSRVPFEKGKVMAVARQRLMRTFKRRQQKRRTSQIDLVVRLFPRLPQKLCDRFTRTVRCHCQNVLPLKFRPERLASPPRRSTALTPGIGQMAWQPTATKQESIETKAVPCQFRMLLDIEGRGARDPFSLPERYRLKRHWLFLAALDLHKGNGWAPHGYQIDFSQPRTPARGQDPVALQPQPPGRQALRSPSAPIGGPAQPLLILHRRVPAPGPACKPAVAASLFRQRPRQPHHAG